MPKNKITLIITSCAVIAAALILFVSANTADAGQISGPAAPAIATEAPKVTFASYKMAEGIPVTMTADSVERDLSIAILDEDSQPITNVAFEVVAQPPKGDPIVLNDDEATGKIYADNLDPGEYTLTLQETGRFIVPEPLTVEVKAKVENKVIENIGDKLVNSKNVNASQEDAKYGDGQGAQTPPPPPPADTVPYYESKTTEKKTDVPVTVTVYVPVTDSDGNILYKDSYLNSLVTQGAAAAFASFALLPLEDPGDPGNTGGGDPGDPGSGGDPGDTGSGGDSGGNPPNPPDNQQAKYKPVLDSDGYLIAAESADPPGRIDNIDTLKSMFQLAEKTVTKIEQKTEIVYQGWQTIDGKTYYYKDDGKPVTGSQVIQGVKYDFDSNGVLQQNTGGQVKGVDISTWQNPINWTLAKNAGISFAMIRAGYRGFTQGGLIEDDKFKTHAQAAQAAGVKVGLYYFSQAVNEREAVEEASAAVAIAKKYGIAVSYPIAIDIEYSNSAHNGRGDGISGAQRTANAKAFCETVRSAGYTPMIYASKSWFESPSYLDISQLSQYRIWLAHWGVAQTSYNKSRIDIWQYTSDGSVPGISGRVDMNISYMGY